MVNDLDVRAVRSFTLLAELGSLAEISRRLHLTPPAIHKQIRTMEESLGVALYERRSGRLELTPAGRFLVGPLREWIALHDQALGALAEWQGCAKGTVRIGTGPTLSSYILPAMLRRFQQQHPGVDLLVETGNGEFLIDSLAHGRIDLAFLVTSDLENETQFVTEALWPFAIVPVCQRGDVPLRGSLRRLQPFPFILFKEGSRMERIIDRYLAAVKFVPRVRMRFDSAEAIKAMTQAGLGISWLPYWTVSSDLRAGSLSRIQLQQPPPRASIALLARKAKRQPNAVTAFVAVARSFSEQQLPLFESPTAAPRKFSTIPIRK